MLLTGCLGTFEECNLKFLKNTKNNQRPPRGSPAKTLAVLINTAEHVIDTLKSDKQRKLQNYKCEMSNVKFNNL
jgi:hypothetical protein